MRPMQDRHGARNARTPEPGQAPWRAAFAWTAVLTYCASAGGPLLVVGGEPLVLDVHPAEAGVHLRRAVVEVPADLLPVLLGDVHGLRGVGRDACLQRRGEPRLDVLTLGLDPHPVVLGVRGGPALGLLVGVGLAPALLHLLLVLVRVELAEHLELLLRRQRHPHRSCLHLLLHRRDHGLRPLESPQQQPVLPPQVLDRVRVVQQGRDVLEREPQLPVQQHLVQPVQVVRRVQPVPGRRPSGRRQQPDPVVVVQRAHRHAGHGRHLADRPATAARGPPSSDADDGPP